ncbi:MAG: NAD(P)-dependent oxidoreductase [Candidatus Aminicenantes bacterium]|nr:NAD(P)-dependent oxidoreductase [Candidatus Aminicenantes bacterium]
MKILVVGGAGYIGSVLLPDLLERGYDIDVIDLFWFGNHLPPGINAINKDIFDLKEKDLESYEVVIFMAGLSNDPMAEYAPAENFISNASAPAFLGYIAKKAGVRRFIYAGSCSVYGYTVNELYDEESPAISDYPYGISKLQGENSVMQMNSGSFSVIAFRQGTVSGYSPRMRLDLVVNTMFKTAVMENAIMVNNPAIWRPVLSIQDAATAYIRAIEANTDISGVFNIASGNYTVGEIGDLVKSGIKRNLNLDIKLNIKHIEDYRNYKVSIEKAKKVLSFHPKYDVDDIVENLVENLEKFKDFENPNYYNIQVFKKLKNKG